MKRSTWLAAIFLVPLGILAIFGPWRATSEAEFTSHGIRVLVCALIAYALIRYGWPPLQRRLVGVPSAAARDNNYNLRLRWPFGEWTVVLLVLVFSMFTVLVSLALTSRFKVPSVPVAAGCVLWQQIAMATGAFLIQEFRSASTQLASQVAALAVIAILCVIFALASPTFIWALSEQLNSAPIQYRNLMYAAPTIVVVIWSVVRVLTRGRITGT
jgi:hypothetical protein